MCICCVVMCLELSAETATQQCALQQSIECMKGSCPPISNTFSQLRMFLSIPGARDCAEDAACLDKGLAASCSLLPGCDRGSGLRAPGS